MQTHTKDSNHKNFNTNKLDTKLNIHVVAVTDNDLNAVRKVKELIKIYINSWRKYKHIFLFKQYFKTK